MLTKLKSMVNKKRIIYGIIILAILVAGYFIFFNKKDTEELLTVHPADFLQQVSASGKVVAKENLELSFEQAGRISRVYAKVGNSVSAGQLLMSQDTGGLSANLQEMQAGIDFQQAKLDQLLSGNSPQDIKVKETSLQNARQAMKDALQEAYTTANDAIFNKTDQMFSNPQAGDPQVIFSTTNAQMQNSMGAKRYTLRVMFNEWNLSLASLDSSSNTAVIISNTKKNINQVKSFIDELSVLVNDPNTCKYSAGSCGALPALWKSDLSQARTNVESVRSSVTLAENGVKNAEDALALAEAPPRDSDIAVFKAQIEQAKASLQNVLAKINEKRIYSPINGVVTIVNGKVGSIISSSDVAIAVISKNNFNIESYVPEINISFIKVGQSAQITLDAYGDNAFNATVVAIDPAETIKDGVSTYKVTLEFSNNDDRIKSGMTGNVIVTTLQKSNVISIPQGIVKDKEGQSFVSVKNGETITETKIETGSVASNGNIEVTSGLKEGDVVVVK